MALRDAVREALRNAAENGEDFEDWACAMIAVDIATYDADCEDSTPAEIEPFVKEWFEEKGETRP